MKKLVGLPGENVKAMLEVAVGKTGLSGDSGIAEEGGR
jgi:hypothetical protein